MCWVCEIVQKLKNIRGSVNKFKKYMLKISVKNTESLFQKILVLTK